jgi:mitogen-activated protein kinase kinase kinase
MTALAARSPYPAPTLSSSMMYRQPNAVVNTHFTSPTESEFSEPNKDSVMEWDEARVSEWLRSFNCGQYVETFRKHNINGQILLELNDERLVEIGIKKIGPKKLLRRRIDMLRKEVLQKSSRSFMNRVSPSTIQQQAQFTHKHPSYNLPHLTAICSNTHHHPLARQGHCILLDQAQLRVQISGCPDRSTVPSWLMLLISAAKPPRDQVLL